MQTFSTLPRKELSRNGETKITEPISEQDIISAFQEARLDLRSLENVADLKTALRDVFTTATVEIDTPNIDQKRDRL